MTGDKLGKAIEKVSEEGGILITTFGLTSSQWDFKECSQVFAIGCTYSFAEDRQSFSRCLGFGKTETVEVTYFIYEGERPFVTSQNRKEFTKKFNNLPVLRPSQMGIYAQCAGSFWIPQSEDKPEFIQKAALRGTQAHEYFERYVKHIDKEIPNNLSDNVRHAIKEARKIAKKCSWYYVEKHLKGHEIFPTFEGTADFIAYDGKTKTLYIMDYKNGTKNVYAEHNYQLMAYIVLTLTHMKVVPKLIQASILQKGEIDTVIFDEHNINYPMEKIMEIVENVKKAEKTPLKHIDCSDCSIFCSARRYKRSKNED